MINYKNFIFLITFLGILSLVGCKGNSKPNTPGSPSGPSSGIVGQSLSFSAYTTDPDDDDIAYQFDWGDGDLSSWSSYVASGDTVSQDHIYAVEGTYEVRARARDIKEIKSVFRFINLFGLPDVSGYEF